MKDEVLLANAGHFDVEVYKPDLEAGSGQEGYEAEHLRLCHGRRQDLKPPGRRQVGEPGFRGWTSGWIMDMSFALQALSAKYVLEHHSTMETGIQGSGGDRP